VIIDAADDLEAAGANALLKSLEEPPRDTIFFLISHAPDRLLPTIRSRCQLLRFDPLPDAAISELLTQNHPKLSDGDRDLIVTAARGAPGQALRFASCDWGKAETQLRNVLRGGASPVQAAAELGRLLLGKANLERFDMFVQRAPAAAAELIRELPLPRMIDGVDIWRQIVALTDLVDARTLDRQMVISRICDLMTRLATHRAI
jgi:DNA polymerase-3 subunit delta'